MMVEVLRANLDANGNRVVGLGAPLAAGDATYVDMVSVPLPNGVATPGTSKLAAAADHVHPATGAGGEIAFSKKAPSANVLVPAGYSGYIARSLEIVAGVSIEVGIGATLEIG